MEQLTTTERLAVFNKLSGGNLHLWSKGKIQAEKAYEVFQTLLTLAKEDPLFLAHLVSRDNTKDLDVLSTIANFKTDADGSYFEDKTAQKPDLRYVSQAKILQMEPAPWPDGAKAQNAQMWCTKKLPRGEYYINFNVGASGIEPNGVSEGNPVFLNLNFIAVKGTTMPDIDNIDNNPNVLGGLKFRKTGEETGFTNWYIQQESWEWSFKFVVEEDMDVSIGFVASFGRSSFFRIFNINQFNQLVFD